jgi:amidase
MFNQDTAAPYRAIAARKKDEQLSRIPKDWWVPSHSKPHPDTTSLLDIPQRCGILSGRELEITEKYDATDLLGMMSRGEIKSREVTEAFCKRAAIAHQVTNCLTEIFFADALRRADELDAYFAKHKKPIGPLHGLPISLKDTFKVPGYDASIGLASLCFSPATEPSALVALLLDAGAVLFCKTNVPQTLMALDSHNNVFGRTLNPLNARVTAGGSSGGEAALIAMRGSVLGVGTDVGGSIRVPAMCTGIYGIKPSWQRVPYAGQEGGNAPGAAKIGLSSSAGPMATSLRDCELFLKVVADARPWERDHDVVYGAWEEQGRLRDAGGPVIGVVRRDGLIDPLPPIQAVLDETVAALKKRGIKVVEMDITPLFRQCQALANAMFSADGGNSMFDLLEKMGEPLSPWLQSRMRRKKPLSLEKIRELHARRDDLRTKFLSIWKFWDEKGIERDIDAFITPVAPHPVPEIDRYNGVSYTSTFVLLDYPAGVGFIVLRSQTPLTGHAGTSYPYDPTLRSQQQYRVNQVPWLMGRAEPRAVDPGR